MLASQTTMKGSLAGRTCVVTGATSGIGEETARGLAGLGARVAIVARSPERGEATRAAIADATGADVQLLLADLSSQAEIRRLAAEIEERHPDLSILVNNAGVVNLSRRTTVDGLEETFAVNHLAYFLLTNLLLDRLRANAPARIVNVGSDAHKFGRLDLDDLQSERSYASMRVYGTSKLANLLFTRELARRLEGSGVTVNCVHPGAVASRLGTNNGWFGRAAMTVLSPFFLSPQKGAETSIHLAASADVAEVSGGYFARKRERRSSPTSQDAALARALWKKSAVLCGLPD